MKLLKVDFDNCELIDGVLSCCDCKESMNAPKKPKSLSSHLMIIFGFIAIHSKCKKKKQ